MSDINFPNWPLFGPIDPDWTLAELLDWLADDDSRSEEEHRILARIEAAASTAAGAPPWAGAPGAVALVRSLDALRRALPALGSVRLGELLVPEAAVDVAVTGESPARRRLQLAISW